MSARLLLVTIFLVTLAGCGGGDGVVLLREWDLASNAVTLPAHVGDLVPRAADSYVLRARVGIPDAMRGQPLTLAIPFFLARASLTVDGVPALSLEPRGGGHRDGPSHAFRLPENAAARGAVDLELVIAHTGTQSEWIDTVPRLSASERGDASYRFVRGFNEVSAIIALTTALLSAFTYLVIFLSDRSRTAHGFFVLEGIAGALYPAYMLGLLTPVLGVYETLAVALGVAGAVVASVYFAHAQFGFGRVHRIWPASLVAVVLLAATMHGPFHALLVLPGLCIAIAMSTIVYQNILLTRLVRRGAAPMDVRVVMASWTILGVAAIPDFIGWLGLGEVTGGVRTACLGIGAIAILQNGALAREHMRSLRQSDRLNVELAAQVAQLEQRHKDVDVLNVELRRQIAARSAQLADALARVQRARPVPRRLVAGEIVGERYRIGEPIGAGAAGQVYRVERTSDGAALALKVLTTESEDGVALARFAREAQIASQVHHPNVVTIVDVDVSSEGFLYLVMELVDGPSLRRRRERFGDVRWATAILAQIAAGLEAVHAAGIVHRDLKPANILLVASPGGAVELVKLADFGISSVIAGPPAEAEGPDRATLQDRGDGSLTATGVVLGTPLYMAPEILRGAKNARSAIDVFSLGVVAFELLTGRLPFGDLPPALSLMGSAEPPSMFAGLPGISQSLGALFNRCLALDPEVRPTARELHEALRAELG